MISFGLFIFWLVVLVINIKLLHRLSGPFLLKLFLFAGSFVPGFQITILLALLVATVMTSPVKQKEF
jgi:hypothetical protein